jgi:CRP-like cAMP-binding protein
MAESFWHLKNFYLFEHLAPADIERLEAVSKYRQLNRGEPVYLPADLADGVLLLISGRVKICQITPDGKQSIMTFIEPGESLRVCNLRRQLCDEYAEAVLNSQFVLIPNGVKRWNAIQSQRRHFRSLGFASVSNDDQELLFQSNRKRLIHLLLELMERYGQQVEDGVANIVDST